MSNESGAQQEFDPEAEAAIQEIYNYAATQMQNNVSGSEIVNRLEEQGLDRETARRVVSELEEVRSEALQAAGKKNMIYGALWCLGGIIVTVISYSAASGPKGGTYIVTWGAIIVGAIQFFQGLSQSSK